MPLLVVMASKPQPGIIDLVGRIGEATRQAALEAVASAASIAANGNPDAAAQLREVANRILAQVAILQCEIDGFLSAVRNRRGEL